MRAKHLIRQLGWPLIGLFTSVGTLLCCALPALLVSLGLGAVLAGVISAVPQIVWLSEHKETLFLVGALLLVLSGVSRHYAKSAPCPTDPKLAKTCANTRIIATVIFWLSVTLYGIGFFFAYFAAELLF